MILEKFAEAFSESAGAVSVNDADALNVREGRVIKKFVNPLSRFLDGGPDQIDFFRCRNFASLRTHRHAAACRLARTGGWRGSLNANDLVHGHFHAQRTGFDFRGAAVEPAENHGLVEAADTNSAPRVHGFA